MNIESIRRSLSPVWNHHKIESIAIGTALLCGLISLAVFIAPSLPRSSETTIEIDETKHESTSQNIVVHIDGAVKKPGVYELPQESRVQDLVKRAEGFTNDADRAHIAQQLNLSKQLTDEEKIYIPFQSNNTVSDDQTVKSEGNTISINNASIDELDSLPGVGAVTAKKIIDARPFSSIEQLLQQKIVSSSTYEKIKDEIGL